MASNDEFPPGFMELIHLLKHDFLMGTLVETLMSGIYTAIIALTVFSLVQKDGTRSLFRPFVGVVIFLYALAVVHVALRWSLIRELFITHGDDPLYVVSLPLGNSLTSASVFILSTFFADSILVWRCWTVYNRGWFPAVIPGVTTIAGLGVGIYVIVLQSDPALQMSSREAFADATIAHNAVNLATTVVATGLIVYRILSSQQLEGNRYRRMIEIIVESAALYTVALIVHMPFLFQDNMTNAFPLAILSQLTGIAPTLLVVRVALGYSRPQSSWTGTGAVETLNFQSEGRTTFGGTRDTYRNRSDTMIDDEEKTTNIEDHGAIR